MACCNTTLIIKQTSFEVASKHWVTGHFRKNIILIPSWHLLFKHWPVYVPFREFLCFLVVESWSLNAKHFRSCALSQKRKRSESWSILSWYSSPLSSGTWHQSGWSSAMQSSIFAQLGTSWHTLCTSSFTSTLDSTLHCLLPICFECLCDTSNAIVCTSSCRDMSKHVEAPLRWGCPEVLHKLLHLRWQLVDSSCSCFLMFLSFSVTSWSCWKASWQPDVHV